MWDMLIGLTAVAGVFLMVMVMFLFIAWMVKKGQGCQHPNEKSIAFLKVNGTITQHIGGEKIGEIAGDDGRLFLVNCVDCGRKTAKVIFGTHNMQVDRDYAETFFKPTDHIAVPDVWPPNE